MSAKVQFVFRNMVQFLLIFVFHRVSRHLFEKCIKNHLKGKLRILVTHQLQYLPQADHVVVLNNVSPKEICLNG